MLLMLQIAQVPPALRVILCATERGSFLKLMHVMGMLGCSEILEDGVVGLMAKPAIYIINVDHLLMIGIKKENSNFLMERLKFKFCKF